MSAAKLTTPPRVSVVMPVWNAERFLARAIQSVLEQTCSTFELLIVDDGSTDGTLQICRRFAQADDRIAVLSGPHAGIAAALNIGIRKARAQYIARMDGDDICLPRRLETQLAYLDSHPECAVVGSNTELLNEGDELIGAVTYPSSHAEIIRTLIGGRRCPFCHPTVVIRASALQLAGGYESDDFPCEDYALWLRLIGAGTFANIPEPLLLYRRHPDSISARENERSQFVATALLNSARSGMGLSRLKTSRAIRARPAIAAYHHECAKALLKVGRRIASIRCASASIASDPLWLKSYALLAACFLPMKLILVLTEMMTGARMPRYRTRRSNAALHESE